MFILYLCKGHDFTFCEKISFDNLNHSILLPQLLSLLLLF